MTINDDKKIDILILALKERYDSIHNIRERVQGIGIWALGLLIAAGGWLVQSSIILTDDQKIFVILGIIVAFIVLRYVYLEDLRRGFIGQQRAAVQIESALKLFTPGAFCGEDTIYPKNWEKAGTEEGGGKFFNSTTALLFVGIALFTLAVLLNGCFQEHVLGPDSYSYHSARWHQN
ncbi:MAG TPA: hypothetical protein VMC41_03610 [Candidatus Nanoarchaeia archaeon]|nr:hypothetical protein [Candidatus Nanoarchaeia archaeon]